MKSIVMPSLVQMDADDLRKLTAVVKETVATDVALPDRKKNFTVMDMWNITRNARSASAMLRR